MIHRPLVHLLGVAVLFVSAEAPAQTPSASVVMPVPAFRKDARVLFQGDSITDGNRGRSMDPNHILGHGYAFIIAASYGAVFPERNLTFLNRGVSGNPTYSGHQLMADEWVRTVSEFWPKP